MARVQMAKNWLIHQASHSPAAANPTTITCPTQQAWFFRTHPKNEAKVKPDYPPMLGHLQYLCMILLLIYIYIHIYTYTVIHI